MNKNTIIILAVVLIVIAGAGGFFAGSQYQKSQPRAAGQFGGRGLGEGNGNGFGNQNPNFRPVRGQVLTMDSNTLTVKLSDGSTKIVVLSGSTVFVKSTTASLSDLKTGDTVNVVGTQNSDGSLIMRKHRE